MAGPWPRPLDGGEKHQPDQTSWANAQPVSQLCVRLGMGQPAYLAVARSALKRIFTWPCPVGLLAALGVMSLLFWGRFRSISRLARFFMLSGGPCLCILYRTDRSPAHQQLVRLVFGMGVGVLSTVISRPGVATRCRGFLRCW